MHRIPGEGSSGSQLNVDGFGPKTPAAGKLQKYPKISLCCIFFFHRAIIQLGEHRH